MEKVLDRLRKGGQIWVFGLLWVPSLLTRCLLILLPPSVLDTSGDKTQMDISFVNGNFPYRRFISTPLSELFLPAFFEKNPMPNKCIWGWSLLTSYSLTLRRSSAQLCHPHWLLNYTGTMG